MVPARLVLNPYQPIPEAFDLDQPKSFATPPTSSIHAPDHGMNGGLENRRRFIRLIGEIDTYFAIILEPTVIELPWRVPRAGGADSDTSNS